MSVIMKATTAPEVLVKTKTKQKGLLSATQVDKLAEMDSRVRELKAQYEAEKREYDAALKAMLVSLEETGELAAEDKAVLKGVHYEEHIGPRAKVSSVDVAAAFAILRKVDKNLPEQLAKFNVTDLRAYLTPMQLAEVLSEEACGNRRVVFKKIE